MSALDPREMDRFSKIIGLMDSTAEGERHAAVNAATKWLSDRQMKWVDVGQMLTKTAVVAKPERRPRPAKYNQASNHRHQANLLLLSGMPWSDWEKKFIRSIAGWTSQLSDKQRDTLASLQAKAAEWFSTRGGDV